MDNSSEYSYTTSEDNNVFSILLFVRETSNAQSHASNPGEDNYTTPDVHATIKRELEGRLEFDRLNVLDRLRIQDVDDELVRLCRDHLIADETFSQSKKVLDKLLALAEGEEGLELEAENTADPADKSEAGGGNGKKKTGEKKIKEKKEKKMMEPLSKIFDRILKFLTPSNDGQVKQYDRKWVPGSESGLRGEGDIFSFPEIKPDFTLCDEDMPSTATKESDLWRHRAAFMKLRATSSQGPKPARVNTVKAIVAQTADYARLHLSCRPFLLFSIGLLIFGKQFCVAIFDRDGVQFSPIYDMWNNLDILIRIMRRMCHEMSPVDLGQDPNVAVLPRNHPNSVACRNLATQLANTDASLINEISTHPTYSVDFCNVKYYTIGLPVWNSLSLLGRGTSIWRVTASPSKPFSKHPFLILKTTWRQSNRPSETAILQRVKGSHDGLVKYSKGSDVFFPSSGAFPPPTITTENLRNMNRHVDGDTTVLHRLIFETVGRPIWEFNSYLEFFLAIKAALNAHQFLADQNILHRDISAGNVLLSSDPDASDSQKGFLTDLEFARIDDETLETKNIIPAPSVSNPDRANKRTVPTTRTHTTWTPPPRGAVLTGTVQFMACELVWSFKVPRQIPHRIHHDVESFVWVMYYAILRRLGYVDRPLAEGINEGLPVISRMAFKGMFGHIHPDKIFDQRVHTPYPFVLFDEQEALLPPAIVAFFTDIHRFIETTVRVRWNQESRFGWGTHEELHVVLDTVIAALTPPPPQNVPG